jgi:beta-lactamase class A
MADQQIQPPKYIYNNYYRGVNSSAHIPIPDNKPKKPRKFRYIFLFILIIIIGYIGWYNFIKPKPKIEHHKIAIVTPKPTTENQPVTDPTAQAKLTTMENAVNAVINQNPGITFEVAITDINNGDQYNFGQTGPMTAASVSKILTATDFLNEVEKGNQTMVETLDDGNNAENDLNSMLVISSDSAWQALEDQLTPNQISDYATNIGVTSFNYENNTLSARDTADVLTSLWNGSLINSADTQLVLGYLKEANYRQYILPAIPSTDTVYHKIGLYTDNVNDATIITNGSQTISLVIFTNGNGAYDWPARAIMMQDITRPILTYYDLN